MTLAPLLAAPAVVLVHTLAALLALTAGIVQMVGPKGTMVHRALGWVWALAMAVAAVSSFGIFGRRPPGSFGWIHLLSLLVLVMLPLAVLAARRGRLREHAIRMRWLFFAGLVLPGAFTLMPGRLMHAVVLGP